MKHLAAALVVFLLMGCQTTNTVPPKDTSPTVEELQTKLDAMNEKLESIEKKKEVVPTPQKKVEQQPKGPKVPTVITTSKPLMCGDPSSILKAITKVGERPLAMWKDAQHGYNVIMLYNKAKKTLTILEYIPGPYACFLSVGIDVHVEGVDFKTNRKKTGVSVQRGLTKDFESVINKVQFVDAD